ncbi:MAG: DUF1540 domain-containing protein [Candidatus Margulisiibacteriota bacterium]|nr:MAG: hypothetical protein A2X43_01010 [Candidatus Margulisbacteria bacterium GWD2_39_127]OGI02407.1 MAG: hypothetical protein A2X42_09660 [Candidatus Margulisbacteria bacterium GWF2_38_17]OGI08540.1 MAG: hypothetical protein A2X41_07445 [Candidatus Margulisbacteria bacterium GWE2_39_32]PZM78191.1 MAG: DUF1540 domain-containing protein [Candidatus Margulisiibacteriota bacterium]HAR63452.1 DUF1540 domain-containing protein [Candidatus Margulisiibacteriota bacterium]
MDSMIPKVLDCEMTDCTYNQEKTCHAVAITVGDIEPVCDTYMKTTAKGGLVDTIGGVGACKVDRCLYNESYECTADGIHVGLHVNHAECSTFTAL